MLNANEPAYAYGNPEQGGATVLNRETTMTDLRLNGKPLAECSDKEIADDQECAVIDTTNPCPRRPLR